MSIDLSIYLSIDAGALRISPPLVMVPDSLSSSCSPPPPSTAAPYILLFSSMCSPNFEGFHSLPESHQRFLSFLPAVLPTSSLSALRLFWSGAEGEPLHLTHGGSVYNQSKFGLFSHPLNSPIPFPLSSGTQSFTHTTLNLTLPSTATTSFHLVASHACLSIKWWRSKLAGAN